MVISATNPVLLAAVGAGAQGIATELNLTKAAQQASASAAQAALGGPPGRPVAAAGGLGSLRRRSRGWRGAARQSPPQTGCTPAAAGAA